MIKLGALIAALIGLAFFLQQRGLHHRLLADVEARHALRVYDGVFQAETLSQFAPLPARDRALITRYCTAVYQQAALRRGTKEALKPGYEPACQALIRGGWHPGWTVADGLAFAKDPDNYVR